MSERESSLFSLSLTLTWLYGKAEHNNKFDKERYAELGGGRGRQGTREKDGATRTFPRTINLHTFSNTNLDQLIGLLSSKGDEGRSRGRGSKRSFSLFGPREGVTDAGGNFVEKIETFDGENTMKPEVGSWGAAENFGNRLAITNRIRVN